MLDPYLKQKDIYTALNISRTTFWSWRKTGHFPPPELLSPNVERWRESTVKSWQENREICDVA